jgi:hypothetical protein
VTRGDLLEAERGIHAAEWRVDPPRDGVDAAEVAVEDAALRAVGLIERLAQRAEAGGVGGVAREVGKGVAEPDDELAVEHRCVAAQAVGARDDLDALGAGEQVDVVREQRRGALAPERVVASGPEHRGEAPDRGGDAGADVVPVEDVLAPGVGVAQHLGARRDRDDLLGRCGIGPEPGERAGGGQRGRGGEPGGCRDGQGRRAGGSRAVVGRLHR